MISKYGRKTLCLFHFTGSSAWPSGVFLKYTSGDQLGPVNLVSVKPLDPGEYYDLSINMISPSKMGMYQGQWRMCNPAGQYFGGELNKMNLYYSTVILCVCVCFFLLLVSSVSLLFSLLNHFKAVLNLNDLCLLYFYSNYM